MRCLLLTYLGMVLVSPALAQEGKQLPPRQGELAPTEEEMAALIRRLGDRKFAARRAASRELLAIGEPARGLLEQAARTSRDAEVRRSAGLILDELDGVIAERIAPLIAQLGDRNFRRRQAASYALVGMGE